MKMVHLSLWHIGVPVAKVRHMKSVCANTMLAHLATDKKIEKYMPMQFELFFFTIHTPLFSDNVHIKQQS